MTGSAAERPAASSGSVTTRAVSGRSQRAAVPDDPHSGVPNPRRLLDVESWLSLLGRIPRFTWGFHRLNPAEIGRTSALVGDPTTIVYRVYDGVYCPVV